MDLNYLLYFSTVLHGVLALFVLIYTDRNASSISFSSMLMGIGLWAFTNAGFQNAIDETQMFLFALLAYSSATLLFFSMCFFSFFITGKRIGFIMYSFFSLLIVVSFIIPYIPNLTIEGVNFESKSIVGSTFLPVLFMTYLIPASISIFNLVQGVRAADIVNRKRLASIAFGTILSIFVGVTTNLILPSLDNYQFVSLGPTFTFIFLLFVTISIVRYQFLDIRILFGRITYFSALAIILVIAYRITIGIDAFLWDGPYELRSLITGIPIAFVVVIIYDSFKKFIQEKVDSTIINPDFNPNEAIAKFNNEVSTSLSYEDVIDHTLNLLGRTLRPKYKGVMIIKDNDLQLTDDSVRNEQFNFDFNKLKKIWNKTDNYPIIVDEVELDMPNQFKEYPDTIKETVNEMIKNEIKILMPISSPDNIVGILIIGQREADSPYNSVQVDFLKSLSNISGLALTRSFLYEEVRDFNQNLQKKVNVATKELEKQNLKLQESLANERDMLDILGHELRTPLGIIRNALGLFEINYKADKLNDEEIQKFLRMANTNIRREIQLLETILASAKIDNAKLDLNLEKVDVKQLIEDAFDAYKYEAEKKGLALKIKIPDNPVFGNADKLRLQQVLDNLVSNAIKYTEEGTIQISLTKEKDNLRVSVKDTGLGIPEKDIKNLGKKFFRVNNYIPSQGTIGGRKIVRPGGNGIGLYVVFQLVKYMGGNVYVESKVGQGSIFSFTLQRYTKEIQLEKEVLTTELKIPKALQSSLDRKKAVKENV